MNLQRKAKAMLTAVAVFAIVGGALAFKAKRGGLIYTAANATSPCTNELNGWTITAAGQPGEQRFASTTTLAVCPQTTVTQRI
jgi:hypothetical protein